MNIGLYPVGSSSKYYMCNAHWTEPAKGEKGIPVLPQQVVSGVQREQDVIPSLKQAVEGASGQTETPPTARAAWRGFPGTMGLYRQSDAPGDLTRCFVSDMDNTRPGQLTAWLQWPGGATVAVDNGPGAHPLASAFYLVNDPVGIGFTGAESVSGNYAWWRWNGTKFALQRQIQGAPATGASTQRLPNAVSTWSGAIVQPTGTNLWMPLSGGSGCTDISVAAAAGVGVANAILTFVYFDILFVIAATGGNLTVTPYRPNTPGAGNVVQSATYNGLANALLTIPGEATCLGAVPCEGAVYLVTDRSVYAIQWNDNNNTFLCTKLFELTRFTGAPTVWNGEVYIPADNRIAHIVPNQRGFDWRTPNPTGSLPAPFSSNIIQLCSSADALYALMTDYTGSGKGWAVLRMDANGVWTCLTMANSSTPSSFMTPVSDGPNGFGIAFVGTTTATIYPVPTTGKNPRTLTSTQRKQLAGPFRLITPWFDLEATGAQKLLQRFMQEVLDASSTYPIRAYYQTDFADEAGSDTFTTGCAKGTGTWHKCFYAAASSSAYAGSTDSGGRGALWFEWDGSTSYADSIGMLPIYPSNKMARFCLEINGDTTGTTVPTILSTLFDRVEFMTKAFQRVYVLRLRAGELNRVSQANGGTTAVSIPDSTTLISEHATLKGYDSAKTKLTEVDEKGVSRTVIMTKFDSALSAVNMDGTPAEYICTVTVLDAALSGLT